MTAAEAMGQVPTTRWVALPRHHRRTASPKSNWTASTGFDYNAQRLGRLLALRLQHRPVHSTTPDGARNTFNGDTRVLTLDSKLSYNSHFGSTWTTATRSAGLQVFNNRTNTHRWVAGHSRARASKWSAPAA